MSIDTETRTPRAFTPRLVLGIGIVIFGIVLTLEQIPGIHQSAILGFVKDLWPLIIVAMGYSKMRQNEGQGRPGGQAMMAVGLFLLLITLGHGHLDQLFGPAILIAIGIFIVLNALKQNRRVPPELIGSEHFLQGTAIFSGFKHRILSQAFKGGEVTAIFGGIELDLRQAVMEGSNARLDVFILFGGGELRVPEGWDVRVQASAIAGGIENKASALLTGTDERPCLLITGTVVFGGIEIKR
jgi:predicted membrane protein